MFIIARRNPDRSCLIGSSPVASHELVESSFYFNVPIVPNASWKTKRLMTGRVKEKRPIPEASKLPERARLAAKAL